MLSLASRQQLYDHYLTEARRWADTLAGEPATELATLGGELGALQFFALPEKKANER